MELTVPLLAGGVLTVGGYSGRVCVEDREDGNRGAVAVLELPTTDAVR